MATQTIPATPPAGALTTAFRPTPRYCETGQSRFSTRDCMPPNWSAYWDGDVGYYSPAICPHSYTSAATRTSFDAGPAVQLWETAIICCPSGYSASSIQSYCYSWVYDQTAAVSSTSSTWSQAYAIQVRWQETDLPNLETDPLRPGRIPTHTRNSPSDTATPAGIATGGASATGTTFTTVQSSGFSKGALVGIVVAVAVVLLAVLAGAFLIFWRRKRAKPAYHAPQQDLPEVMAPTPNGYYDPSKQSAYATSYPVATQYYGGGHPQPVQQQQQHAYPQNATPPIEMPTSPSATQMPTSPLAAPASVPVQHSRQPSAPSDVSSPPIPTLLSPASSVAPTRQTSIGDLASSSNEPPVLLAPGSTTGSADSQPWATDEEMAQIRQRQAQLQDKRQRLLQLQEIEEEEERLKMRLSGIDDAQRGSFSRG
ncbi:hypothetical protein W97_00438 [Coniosporium apollinis CBS 100218]|uniref:Uncharacterized protein n=1 Tax=Coniosporium apollinis (strain CBS 100218) TaxID=1168221 RepID=R7YH41_CONA1|nr:uncharacterized protein W97_00438 [Coniosporium apollinis CBS 100218]EON61225.1 hypothetical protein W97_00438 [Coniosporium apollinis CBS 100218]